ncbi:DUF1028 domain-containing protein [Cytobacillus firmus]|uniref:DUF1028 domain-containing protein n=1 Tax=Cytobacillus firmus TaxID=1399 RepID=UPI00077C4549|nr:DUF1028 domain-containing protein [Cytobacillus firmus]MBG9542321.1 major pilin protein FimA [Cytobacillus firmus]MBG9548663.1 major pilin protein FimA [Cytobacillus firmus]MBG9553550.1 major pilin protein FimA [Cytobacillus firmus]MBG9557728.1 major pilin protein FimA [Cytobacillus firmus]MBG9573922.1 major pilin protein FimA [Cytobacillus firmus]
MTFSIIGYDQKEKEWGIAVQSKFLGVGAVVPFAKAGIGAVATQSYANTSYGPRALQLMEEGKTAEEALEIITKDDPEKELRQVGLLDSMGNPATFTGEGCYDWAGGMTGPHFAAQGNILVDEKTVEAMGQTFISTDGTLAERLLAALNAGQAAGGDSRGQQSAALLVVKEAGGYGGFNDRYIDLRVDDHPEPISELIRIYHLQQLYFAPSKAERIAAIEGEIKEELVRELTRLGYLKAGQGDDQLLKALTAFIHTENFEAREQEAGKIDLDVLAYMKKL